MTRRILVLLFAIGLAACGGGGDDDDEIPDGSPAPAVGDCDGIQAAWQGIVDSLDDTCDSDADCIEVGGNDFATCNCAPVLGDGAEAAQGDAYAASGGPAMAARFYAECHTNAICDRAPSEVHCSSNGHCGATSHSCFDCPGGVGCEPDAGIGDGGSAE